MLPYAAVLGLHQRTCARQLFRQFFRLLLNPRGERITNDPSHVLGNQAQLPVNSSGDKF